MLEHGITDEEVAEAPPWSQVLPELLAVTAGRSILAYNASFDEGVVARRIHRDGLDLGHLAEDGRWACLMGRRTDWALRRRLLPLSGGHCALDDCQTAYELLCAMTSPSHSPSKRDR